MTFTERTAGIIEWDDKERQIFKEVSDILNETIYQLSRKGFTEISGNEVLRSVSELEDMFLFFELLSMEDECEMR